MRFVVPIVLALVALIHLTPAVGVLGSSRLVALYGLPVDDPNLAVLLRHRAVLFGMFGAFLALAAIRPPLHAAGLLVGLVSVVSFLLLAWSHGGLNASMARVVRVDLVALALLIVGGLVHLAARGEPGSSGRSASAPPLCHIG